MSDAWALPGELFDDGDPVGQDHEHLGGGHYLVSRYKANPLGVESLVLEAVGPGATLTELNRALAGWMMSMAWTGPVELPPEQRTVSRARYTRHAAGPAASC